MPIDTSIYNRIKPMQIDSPFEIAAGAEKIRGLRNTNRLADLAYGQQQSEITQGNALSQAYKNAVGTDGSIDRSKLYTGVAQSGAGAKLPGIQKGFAEQDKIDLANKKAKLEEGMAKFSAMMQLQAGVKDQASHTAAKQQAIQMFGDDAAAKIPDVFDPVALEDGRKRALSMEDQMAQQWKEIDAQLNADKFGETKRHNRVVEGNSRATLAQGGKPPSGYRWGQNGALEPIPGGPGAARQSEVEYKREERDNTRSAKRDAVGAQIAVIDKALAHPGRKTATGLSGSIDPRNFVPGTNATDFRVVLDQIGGTAFLQAFESLKGGGQITEVEGKKATDAIARLNRAQSDEEFETSLKDLRAVMIKGRDRLVAKNSAAPPASAATSPQDQQALDWANANPTDPRAAQIKQRLGM